MSLDFSVYTRDIKSASLESFKAYALSLNLKIGVDEEIDLINYNGYIDIKIKLDFIEPSLTDYYQSGFEYYLYPYEKPKVKISFLDKLLKRTPKIEFDPMEEIIKDSMHITTLCIHENILEKLIIYVYGAYMCKYFEGVFEEMQTGIWCDNEKEMIKNINNIISEIKEKYKKGDLKNNE